MPSEPYPSAYARDGSVFHAVIADSELDGWGRRVIQRNYAKRRKEARRVDAATLPSAQRISVGACESFVSASALG